jgi:hypothetical protein
MLWERKVTWVNGLVFDLCGRAWECGSGTRNRMKDGDRKRTKRKWSHRRADPKGCSLLIASSARMILVAAVLIVGVGGDRNSTDTIEPPLALLSRVGNEGNHRM